MYKQISEKQIHTASPASHQKTFWRWTRWYIFTRNTFWGT